MDVSQSNPSEVREVLSKYLELFEQKSIDFKYFLAPNSVIDWYGRTIRGANKIHDYLRHEIHNQFDHIEFSIPEQCGPIETKTSHMRTKIISTKPIDNVHPINRVPDMVPLKSYADSDVEDNNEVPEVTSSIAAAVVNANRRTPEKCTSTLAIEELTPPASATKEEEEHPQSYKDSSNINEDQIRKSLKRSHSGRFSYLRRLPTAPSTSKQRMGKDYHEGIRTLLDDSSSEEDDLDIMEALYTPLKYIEVKGVMLNSSSAISRQRSALWRDSTQLETRLRISYRRQLEDKQIQFALIIYESLNVVATPTRHTKRNLMSQFTMASVDDNNQDDEQEADDQVEAEEMIIEAILNEPVLIEPQASSTSTLMGNTEDPLNEEERSLASLSVAHLRTPTKFNHTPPATPKRKPRSSFQTTSGLKRLNSSPTAPTPKRSAARSLRL